MYIRVKVAMRVVVIPAVAYYSLQYNCFGAFLGISAADFGKYPKNPYCTIPM